MKRKLTTLTIALMLALTVTAGSYAFGAITDTTSIDASVAGGGGGDSFVSVELASGQPYWDSLAPYSEPDQEILRPNADGWHQNINFQFPASGNHWDKVDDLAPDDFTTYVYTDRSAQFDNDSYMIKDHVDGYGAITGITVYFSFASDAGATASARAEIITHNNTYTGTTELQTGNTFSMRSYTWALNPATGVAWTWAEVDDMQVGVQLKAQKFNNAYCTQVFVLVDFEEPPVIEGNIPTGNLFVITPHADYTGDIMVNLYLVNTGALNLAYQHLNIKVYLAESLEAGQDPDYQVLSLSNGLAQLSIPGGAAVDYTIEVIGGGYALMSDDPYEWGEGFSLEPEFYCEVVPR